jgi:hypothetical protein
MRARAPFSSGRQRGGVLLTAMLLATALAIGLAGYAALARQAVITAQRTFHVRDALGLAEAGLEEAIDCYRQMDAGIPTATAWADWTVSGGNARRTLTPFDRDGRALATVKIYVRGYDGTLGPPLALAQATVVPFDGSAPIRRIAQLTLEKQNFFVRALVGRQGLTFSGQASTDSYNSNPAASVTGPWAAYPGTGARSNTLVIVPTGAISLSSNSSIGGNLALGSTVVPPPANKVSGTITTNFTGSFPMPVYPTAASVSRSYSLGGTIPAVLPVAGHLPAADGRYYYFCTGATIANVSITANRAVTIVGTTTSLGGGLALQGGASLTTYIDGAVNAGNNAISNGNWAGALQIFTSTSASCSIGGNGSIYACLYAPNAALSCSGGGSTGMLVGSYVARTISSSGHMDFHYDEALQQASAGTPWTITGWYERRAEAERTDVATITGNFLP